MPAEQAPRPAVAHVPPPPALSSSIRPSQSLSIPSQISGVGSVAGKHWSAPPRHDRIPAEHAPKRGVVHAPPPSGLSSSIRPSQSLSIPSQISALGSPAEAHISAPP